MTIKIYLRSVFVYKTTHLAMFDTNRYGAVDNLTTYVSSGDTVIWKPDRCSGISSITKISSKHGIRNIFKTDPKKRFYCEEFILQIPLGLKEGEEEEYTIEYITKKGEKVIIDPIIKIDPPPTKG